MDVQTGQIAAMLVPALEKPSGPSGIWRGWRISIRPGGAAGRRIWSGQKKTEARFFTSL